jgi:hypothetical protein
LFLNNSGNVRQMIQPKKGGEELLKSKDSVEQRIERLFLAVRRGCRRRRSARDCAASGVGAETRTAARGRDLGAAQHGGVSIQSLTRGREEIVMFPFCPTGEHLSRRAFLKGALVTAGGLAVPNWGGLFNSHSIAAEAAKQGKRCILLWMNGGASQIDTFDMKPGRTTGGPFRPAQSKIPGIHVCEYLPKMTAMVDKLAIIRSMRTQSPDHPDGIYTCTPATSRTSGCRIRRSRGDRQVPRQPRRRSANVRPHWLDGQRWRGYLGPKYEPFGVGRDGKMPYFTQPYAAPDAEQRRGDLLRFMETEFGKEHRAEPFESHRLAKERAWRLLRAKQVFDTSKDWPQARERYGETEFGRGCFRRANSSRRACRSSRSGRRTTTATPITSSVTRRTCRCSTRRGPAC